MPNPQYKFTFHLGSGVAGMEMVELLKHITDKLGTKESARTLRVALRIVDKLAKDHPAIKAALEHESQNHK